MAFGSVNVPGDLSGYQRKLTGLPGQAVWFDASGAAVAVRGWSNQSLIDNGYFLDPANQRGQKEYANDYSYCIDRWKHVGKITVDSSGLHNSSGGPIILWQLLENSVLRELDGEMITASYLLDNGKLVSESYIFYNDIAKTEGRILGTRAGYEFNFISFVIDIRDADAGAAPVAAKLELGSVQTLAHKEGDTWVLNGPPPDKTLELLKCQRYFRSGYARYVRAKENWFYPTDYSFVPMRATPTMIVGDITEWMTGVPGVAAVLNIGGTDHTGHLPVLRLDPHTDDNMFFVRYQLDADL